jgi:hypothetical protein
MADPKLIEALSNASSLELFELSTIVDRLLADPRRILAIRQRLNLGKAVQFMDWRTGQMRSGKVVELKSNQVTVHEDGTRSHWKLSYAAIDPGASNERLDDSHGPTLNQAPVHTPGPEDFHRGDKVSFTDKYLQTQVGIITRINQRTATVDCEGGAGWRVPFAMLRHVMDI